MCPFCGLDEITPPDWLGISLGLAFAFGLGLLMAGKQCPQNVPPMTMWQKKQFRKEYGL